MEVVDINCNEEEKKQDDKYIKCYLKVCYMIMIVIGGLIGMGLFLVIGLFI